MAVNYAVQYSKVIDELFKLNNITEPLINNDYDFDGVSTVFIYSVETSPINNYSLTGSNRYGTPVELGNSTQPAVLTQDKSFTYTIDKKSITSTNGVMNPASSLARQLRERVIPSVDKYRLGVAVSNAAHVQTIVATQDNAYEIFLTVNEQLDESEVPSFGRVAYMTNQFAKFLKLDHDFIKNGDMSQNMLINGIIGVIDGVSIIKVPSSYFPLNVDLLIAHPSCISSPFKIYEFKVKEEADGISGALVEGRFYYDAFARENKKVALSINKSV
jgi:hypothetical protein